MAHLWSTISLKIFERLNYRNDGKIDILGRNLFQSTLDLYGARRLSLVAYSLRDSID